MDSITPINLETQRSGKEKHAEEHLANHCSNVLQLVLHEYMEK
ncbi:22307_t:CDS:2, partial [Rhizophagus irregularis]